MRQLYGCEVRSNKRGGCGSVRESVNNFTVAMGCLWDAYGRPMGPLQAAYGLPMSCLWAAYVMLMGCLWAAYELSMSSLWESDG